LNIALLLLHVLFTDRDFVILISLKEGISRRRSFDAMFDIGILSFDSSVFLIVSSLFQASKRW